MSKTMSGEHHLANEIEDEEKSVSLTHVPTAFAVAAADENDDVRRAFVRKMYACLVADQGVSVVVALVCCAAPVRMTIYDWRLTAVISSFVLRALASSWSFRRRRGVVGAIASLASTLTQALFLSIILALLATMLNNATPGDDAVPTMVRIFFIIWSSQLGSLVASFCTDKPATRKTLAAGAVVGTFAAIFGTRNYSLFPIWYDVMFHAALVLALQAFLIRDVPNAMSCFSADDAPLAASCLGASRRTSAVLIKSGWLQPVAREP